MRTFMQGEHQDYINKEISPEQAGEAIDIVRGSRLAGLVWGFEKAIRVTEEDKSVIDSIVQRCDKEVREYAQGRFAGDHDITPHISLWGISLYGDDCFDGVKLLFSPCSVVLEPTVSMARSSFMSDRPGIEIVGDNLIIGNAVLDSSGSLGPLIVSISNTVPAESVLDNTDHTFRLLVPNYDGIEFIFSSREGELEKLPTCKEYCKILYELLRSI